MKALKIQLTSMIPIFSMIFLMLGNGLYNTLISIRLKDAGETDLMVGVITSVYYFGIFLGAFNLSAVIIRIGHIRSFAAFAAILAISVIVPGMYDNIIVWAISRLAAGYSLAGLYITIESWLLNMSTQSTRGKYLALYMITLYIGQAGGQLFLIHGDYTTIMPFCIATILTMVAIIPIAMMNSSGPQIEEPQTLGFKELYKISPTGIIGCVASGAIIASIYGLLPIYFQAIEYNIQDVAVLMAITIFGGVVLQYPIGHLSDIIDRRVVMVLICIFVAIISLSTVLSDQIFKNQFIIVTALVFIFGGLAFTLYPLCMSHV